LILKTSDHNDLVPAVILMGAALALFADVLSQAPGTRIVLPLNAITSLIGAPVVIGVILRRRQVIEAGV
jgi:iron complex transport system permease protein